MTVQVHFLKPMLYEDYKDMKTVEIAAAVEQQIQETINKNLTKEKGRRENAKGMLGSS